MFSLSTFTSSLFIRTLAVGAVALTVASTTIAAPSIAQAEFKIATVDVNKILNESTAAKTKRKDLDERAGAARKKLEEKGKSLKERKDKLELAKDKADPKEVEKFRADARDFERTVKDTDEDLKKEFLKFNRELADKAVKLINEYAKKNQIDLVLDKSQGSRGPVLFGQPSFDITSDITQEMNKA
jgi:Skp family chaperone for outer membrane proteins